MTELGVIHGRFQVLHNDHLKYLLAGKERCRHLVVGITNPDPVLSRYDPADPMRSAPLSNPLTYYERQVMVRRVLLGAGVGHEEFSTVPFPVNLPDLYVHYVPLDAVFYLTIYDQWGLRKLERFQAMGLRTEVIWRRPPEGKGLSAGGIRRAMVEGGEWKHMVPPETAALMEEWGVSERLRRLYDMPAVTP